MSDYVFKDAYERVRSRHSNEAWFGLTPREIADSIYREIRLLDRERVIRTEAAGKAEAEAAE